MQFDVDRLVRSADDECCGWENMVKWFSEKPGDFPGRSIFTDTKRVEELFVDPFEISS
jgi:hypothetical protein